MENDPLFWIMLAIVALAVFVGCFMLFLYFVWFCIWLASGCPEVDTPRVSLNQATNSINQTTQIANIVRMF